MLKKTVLSLVCAGVLAASDTELEQLKKQMVQLQQQLGEMQKRIEMFEATPVTAISDTASDEEMLQKMATKSDGGTVTSLLPDIALILNGGYTSRNVSNTPYSSAAIPGFGTMEIQNNGKDGFNLNYAELAMSSTVDPYFDANAIFHIHGDGTVEVEEAFFTTRALDYGLRFKAGKFKSAFGRVNEKHHHAWNFEDQELVNNAFFGPDGIGGEGAQLQWVAPTPFYLMAGLELFNGNPNQGFSAKESASTAVTYLKGSIDIGNVTVLAGLSYAQGKSVVQDMNGSEPIVDSFTSYGQTRICGADLTVEYPLGGYSSLIWQNEWMQRNKDDISMTDKQAGYYSELMYKIDENWATGIRYDEITKNSYYDANLAMAANVDNLHRTSIKLEYKPFEFSRFRLQYNQDHSKYIDDQAKTIHEVMLNYTLELGAHGAHAF